MLNSNRTLAEENLKKEPELIERRSRISDLSEQGKELCGNVHEKLEQVSKCVFGRIAFVLWCDCEIMITKFQTLK